jgi:hypothetical protein
VNVVDNFDTTFPPHDSNNAQFAGRSRDLGRLLSPIPV